jgi:hypothetical protein
MEAVANTPQEQVKPDAPPPPTLVGKLAAVMAAVERVPKSGWNDFHKYHYATEADLSDAVRSNLAKNGVMLIPSVDKIEWRGVQTKNGEEKIATLTVRFTATDGKDKIEFTVIGEGQDRGDKATYKAMTSAMKYALVKLFLIPTGDDPEKEEDDKPAPRAPRPAPKPAAAKNIADAAQTLGGTVAPSTPPTLPATHAFVLWAEVKNAKGEAKAKDPRKTRDAFAEAAKAIWGDKPKPSAEWTPEDVENVRKFIFGDVQY